MTGQIAPAKVVLPSQIFYWLIAVVFFTLPLQPLWIRAFEYFGASDSSIWMVTNWAGLVILVTALISFCQLLTDWRSLKLETYLVIGFIALGILTFFWRQGTVGEYVTGLRYSIFAVIAYFIGRSRLISVDAWDQLLKWILRLVLVVGLFQIILWLIGADRVTEMFGLGKIHFAGTWPRLSSSLPGPNQLATFLSISTLWLFWRQKIGIITVTLATMMLVLTFSRSAILGFAAGLVLPYIFIRLKQGFRLKPFMIISVIATAALLLVLNVGLLKNNFIDSRHTDSRLATYAETIERFNQSSSFEIVFGHGAGTAGPATYYNLPTFIPENWLLQIGYEYGLLGLAILIGLWVVLIIRSIRSLSPWLMSIVLAIAINSLFLHPLSDNIAAAVWFYSLAGLGVIVSNDNRRETI